MWVRMVCLPGGIYRVVAVSAGSYHDDPVISRFLDSFRVEAPPPARREGTDR